MICEAAKNSGMMRSPRASEIGFSPSPRPAPSVGLGVFLSIGAACGFLAIAINVHADPPSVPPIDQAVAVWFHTHRTPGLTTAMNLATGLGSTAWVCGLGLCAALMLTWRRHWYRLLAFGVAVAGGMVLSVILKTAFHRTRSGPEAWSSSFPGFGFPSGHTMAATLLYGGLAACVFDALSTRRVRAGVVFGAISLVALVGSSRLALGAHYLTDVAAAAAAGFSWLFHDDGRVASSESRAKAPMTSKPASLMHRRNFIGLAVGGTLVASGAAAYLVSDKSNLLRDDLKPEDDPRRRTQQDESEILLPSLAPSGHNTQPWFVEYVAPYHWIIGNDQHKWLPAVDPQQREPLLSLGAFLQTLELAALAFGYACRWTLLATTNQDARVMEVRLTQSGSPNSLRKFQTKLIEHKANIDLDGEDLQKFATGVGRSSLRERARLASRDRLHPPQRDRPVARQPPHRSQGFAADHHEGARGAQSRCALAAPDLRLSPDRPARHHALEPPFQPHQPSRLNL